MPAKIALLVVIAVLFVFLVGATPALAGSDVGFADCGTTHTMRVVASWGWKGSIGATVDHVYANFTDGANSSTVYFRMRNGSSGAWTSAEGPNSVAGYQSLVWTVGNPEAVRIALQVKWGSNPWQTAIGWL